MPRRKIRPNLDVDITWDDVQNKPSTFPPSSHNHDERYYTETELQTSGQSQVHWDNVSNKPSLITGSGTTNTIPKFTGTNAIGDSVIYENSGNVGIGTTSPTSKFHLRGTQGNLVVNTETVTNSIAIEAFNDGNTAKYPILLNPWGGNVGIGTTAPGNLLELKSSNPFLITNTIGNSGGIRWQRNGIDRFINSINSDNNLVFSRFNSSGTWLNDPLILDSGGDITIGTANKKIYVLGNIYISTTDSGSNLHIDKFNGVLMSCGDNTWSSKTVLEFGWDSFNGDWIELKVPGYLSNTAQLRLNQFGNVGIGTTTPGAKLAIIGGVNIGGTTDPGYGNLYVVNNCSADSFTDRTEGYDGDALSEIKRIKNKDGELDHDTLPEFVKKEIKLTRVKEGGGREVKEVIVTQGRDIGAMVTMLTVAIQQLLDRLEKLEAKIK